MIAAIFHVVLLVIGGFWIFQIIREPEKKVDFMPPRRRRRRARRGIRSR